MPSIDLTESDSQLFLKFRQYQTLFEKLVECGVFETKSDSVELHFNSDKKLVKIVKGYRV